MSEQNQRVIVSQMVLRKKLEWTPEKHRRGNKKRLLRYTGIFAAVSVCIGGMYLAVNPMQESKSVMSHLTAGFQYDESLGRLQFVSNILPESAMVFLSKAQEPPELKTPVHARQTHAWSSEEPWIEYDVIGDVFSCHDGEVMTVVKNRQDEYTVCIAHENNYQSIYSGLSSVNLKEADLVEAGEQIGTAVGFTAFELRKEGLSIMPVFAEIN